MEAIEMIEVFYMFDIKLWHCDLSVQPDHCMAKYSKNKGFFGRIAILDNDYDPKKHKYIWFSFDNGFSWTYPFKYDEENGDETAYNFNTKQWGVRNKKDDWRKWHFTEEEIKRADELKAVNRELP